MWRLNHGRQIPFLRTAFGMMGSLGLGLLSDPFGSNVIVMSDTYGDVDSILFCWHAQPNCEADSCGGFLGRGNQWPF